MEAIPNGKQATTPSGALARATMATVLFAAAIAALEGLPPNFSGSEVIRSRSTMKTKVSRSGRPSNAVRPK